MAITHTFTIADGGITPTSTDATFVCGRAFADAIKLVMDSEWDGAECVLHIKAACAQANIEFTGDDAESGVTINAADVPAEVLAVPGHAKLWVTAEGDDGLVLATVPCELTIIGQQAGAGDFRNPQVVNVQIGTILPATAAFITGLAGETYGSASPANLTASIYYGDNALADSITIGNSASAGIICGATVKVLDDSYSEGAVYINEEKVADLTKTTGVIGDTWNYTIPADTADETLIDLFFGTK